MDRNLSFNFNAWFKEVELPNMKNIWVVFLAGILSLHSGFAQSNNNGTLDQLDEFSGMYTFPFTMPDGVKLMTDVYMPVTQDCMLVDLSFASPLPALTGPTINLGKAELIQKFTQYLMYDSLAGQPNPNPYQLPLVFTRTPYDKEGDPTGQFIALFGYASAVQDMRGRYSSEGVYMPMYSDSWDKNPYHPNYKHILDVTPMSDPKNGNKHEDGYNSIRYIVDSLTWNYGNLPHTNNKLCNGSVGMFGASALGNTQLQAAAAHYINPSAPGLKCLLPIVATVEHYRYTGYQNGVFRDRIVTGWLKGQIFTGTDDDLIPLDHDIQNNIHTSFDYGLPNKFDAANKAIDHFVEVSYDNAPPGYYPNSPGRADMDASAAPVDANGNGSATGQFSRYTNMNVPTYHFTGWWDIFIDGQIETWQLQKKHTLPAVKDKHFIVIGPWAHQTIGSTKTGDHEYLPNVADVMKINIDDFDETNVPLAKALQSELIGWFRYNLNYRPGEEIGEPKMVIPASTRWQTFSSSALLTIKARIPSQDLVVPLKDLINFLTGNGDLNGLNLELAVITPFTNDTLPVGPIPIPNLGPIVADFQTDSVSTIPFTDFGLKPAVRFYVIGPVNDSVPENANVGNYWYGADRFPLVNHIRPRKIFLHKNGNINWTQPVEDEGYNVFVHDPDDPILTCGGANMIVRTPQGDRDSQGQMNFADPLFSPYSMDRTGVIKFETEPIADSLAIIGFSKVNMWAKTNPAGAMSGPTDTDFFVRFLDVYPDGREFFVFEGCVNARARDYARFIAENGVEDRNAPYSNINIGQLYNYFFQTMPMAYVWGKNHKMKILISSSNYTRYQVNPNLPVQDNTFFRRKPGDGQSNVFNGQNMVPRVAVQRIHFSPEHPFWIELPTHDPTYNVGVVEDIIKDPALDVIVFPNPSDDLMNVYVNKPGEYEVRVINMLGQTVFKGTMPDRMEIRAGEFQPGVYIVEVLELNGNGKIVKKIVVE